MHPEESTASALIDEQIAWQLLRRLPAALGGVTPVGRVRHDPRRDVWLQVDPTGEWVASGPLTDPARELLELYVPLQLQDQIVIGQTGQSLDGRIATKTGHSHYITGAADILHLHRLRALVDAVVVGARTVMADNPRLTVRAVEGTHPVRVVLDPNGRVDRTCHLFTDGAARTIEVRRLHNTVETMTSATPTETDGDDNVIRLPLGSAGFAPSAILDALRTRGLKRVLVEGGGVTVSRFLEARVLDRLHVAVAPVLIGSGRPGLVLNPIASLDQALRPACRHFRLGDDMLFDLDLRTSRTARSSTTAAHQHETSGK